MAQFEIRNIVPNPFRHIDRYPIRKDKVIALRESIRKTDFWENIVAREKDGKAEIAYGHHRLVALREEYGPNHKVSLIIKDLSDEKMLQVMARENMEEWGTSASVEQETVRAVVQAFADGLIELPDFVPGRGIIPRYAPHFGENTPDAPREKPYTAQTLADFIGWVDRSGRPQQKVLDALTALQFIDDGILKESDFDGLSTSQARAVVAETRKAREWREDRAESARQEAERAKEEAANAATEAKRERALKREKAAKAQERTFKSEARQAGTHVGRSVSSSLKKGEIGYRQAGDVAHRVDNRKRDQPRPDIASFAKRLSTNLYHILSPDHDDRVTKLDELVRFRADLDEYTTRNLRSVLEGLSKRALSYAAKFASKSATETERPVRSERKLIGKRR
jgi:hypothetical protein